MNDHSSVNDGELAAPDHSQPKSLGRLVFHSLCSAASAVVPVPLLDDHLVKLTRRRMVREIAADHQLCLSDSGLAVLSGTEPKPLGCGCVLGLVVSLAFKIITKIVRRVFRTILFWLLIKDAADAASETFHEGYLIRGVLSSNSAQSKDKDRVLEGKSNYGEPLASAEVQRLRAPVDGALAQIESRALNHLFRGILSGSRRLLLAVARTLGRLTGLRRETDAGEETLERELEDAIPESLIDSVAASIGDQPEYLRHLDQLLRDQIALCEVRSQSNVNSVANPSAGSGQAP